MYQLDSNTRREAQGIRVCAGIVLLLITMLLTRLQDEAMMPSAPLKKNTDISRWAHTVVTCKSSNSRVVFFSLWPDTVVSWHQTIKMDEKNVQDEFDVNGYESLDGRPFAYSQQYAKNDTQPIHDIMVSRVNGKIVPLTTKSANCATGMCYVALIQTNGLACSKRNFLQSLDQNACSSISGDCYTLHTYDDLLEVASDGKGLGSNGHELTSICGDAQLTTLAYDQNDNSIWFSSGRGSSWYVNHFSLDTGTSSTAAVPSVNEEAILKVSYVSTINTRLGAAGNARVTDVPNIAGEPQKGDQEQAIASAPFLIYVAQDYIVLFRNAKDVGVILHIFNKTGMKLTKSIQFDHMDSAWIIDAADSQASNYLLLMGKILTTWASFFLQALGHLIHGKRKQ
ncbi:putative transmembrane protein [Gregarina niphandrodes]|uniref:Transmembrane protein n=1 Tax=Gregarina niphandrodes TaxID=110365 RepID=A0A023B1R3_GRENI|nr:putative transmembrane protein [Gregarina niphandrodes]EZG46514.1 putative transmembrane protein [Gregarina niphandrodes]|eukprot:XP_011132287.1 putative transmembrane protein [Gregarina niphandrodes]